MESRVSINRIVSADALHTEPAGSIERNPTLLLLFTSFIIGISSIHSTSADQFAYLKESHTNQEPRRPFLPSVTNCGYELLLAEPLITQRPQHPRSNRDHRRQRLDDDAPRPPLVPIESQAMRMSSLHFNFGHVHSFTTSFLLFSSVRCCRPGNIFQTYRPCASIIYY